MPEVDKKISIVHTPCKDCVFAIYNESNTQIDCKTNMLTKFRDKGYEILEAYDNDKEFFVINNKKCIFMRNDSWFKNKKLESIEEAVVEANKENSIKYILLLEIDDKSTKQNIETTIDYFCGQNISPIGILVMIDQKHSLNIDIKTLAKYLDKQKIKWRIQKFIDLEMTGTQKIKAVVQSAPINRYYYHINPANFQVDIFDIDLVNNKLLDGIVFGCLDVAGGLLFSYLSWQYAKSNQNIDILLDTQYHLKYEELKLK